MINETNVVNLLGSRIAGGNSEYGRKQSDFYPTPPETTISLLNHLDIPIGSCIWEPACGEGHMAKVFEENGYDVVSTDINYQGYGAGGVDFLEHPLIECDWIITNPPFNVSDKFIKRCSEHKKPFALLLKSQYWHSKKRYSLFKEIQPTKIFPLTWRPDFLFKTRGNGSPLMDCIWCVWEHKTNETIYMPILKK